MGKNIISKAFEQFNAVKEADSNTSVAYEGNRKSSKGGLVCVKLEPPDLLRNANSVGLSMKCVTHMKLCSNTPAPPRKKSAQRMSTKEKIGVETQLEGDSLNARAHHGADPRYEVTFLGHDMCNQPDSPALFSSCTKRSMHLATANGLP
jgi:hypothetical protein